ncbi:MAG: RNA polymerase sigma factor [Bacillota bacterium]|nr:RNA polymerase sigma factor [Bacillota bacterium]
MDDIVILIEKLMAEHSNDLKRTAYVMLGDEQLSEDVTQETFISFYKNHHKFRGESSYKTYLYRILLNHIKMHWRKKTPQTLDSLIENSDVLIFEDLLVNVLDLHNALRQLKDTYKEVITLHYFNEYSIEEIGTILDLSNSNVKMRLKRGRDVLKKNLIGGINS